MYECWICHLGNTELSVRRVFDYWANTLYLGDAIQSGWIVFFDLVSLGENINKAGI